MKALALVNIDNETGLLIGTPIKIYAENATQEKLDVYFSDCERLFAIERHKSQIQKRDETLLQAEINRISALGFIHVSNYEILVKQAVEQERRNVFWEKMMRPITNWPITAFKAVLSFLITKFKRR